MAMAKSERFDIYWKVMIVHTTDAVLKVHTLDARTALVNTIGFAAAMAIPAYQQISNACKGDQLKDPDVVQTCQRVASVMRQGDTYITEMIGVAIAKRVCEVPRAPRRTIHVVRTLFSRSSSHPSIAVRSKP